MKKSLALAFVLVASAVAIQSQAAGKRYAYDCECSAEKKKCLGRENLKVLIKSGYALEATIGDYEWEFNEGFTASLSKDAIPKNYRVEYERFKIADEYREFLPGPVDKGDLLVQSTMKSGAKSGEVAIVDKKSGRVTLTYACDPISVDGY